jgi:hypothetical protein
MKKEYVAPALEDLGSLMDQTQLFGCGTLLDGGCGSGHS